MNIDEDVMKAQHMSMSPNNYVHIAELAAANKAIVALSEALNGLINTDDPYNGSPIHVAYTTLKTHAPAIEKARGG